MPDAFKAQVEPFIPAIVDAIHQAFSIATGAAFMVGIASAAIAAVVAVVTIPGAGVTVPVEEPVSFRGGVPGPVDRLRSAQLSANQIVFFSVYCSNASRPLSRPPKPDSL